MSTTGVYSCKNDWVRIPMTVQPISRQGILFFMPERECKYDTPIVQNRKERATDAQFRSIPVLYRPYDHPPRHCNTYPDVMR